MTLIPPISWIAKVVCWVLRFLLARRDLDRLQARVGQLEASAPPRPHDLKLLHGLYWGFADGASERHAYCPACAAQGVYVPLSRKYHPGVPSYVRIEEDEASFFSDPPYDPTPRSYGTTEEEVSFHCPKCDQRFYLKPGQEREALGS